VTPDFASMTMSSMSISLAFASGTSASSAAVGYQPGQATSRADVIFSR
jgi:hypothetical protein